MAPLDTTLVPRELPNVPGVHLSFLLGRGGFASVFAGEQVSLRRPVAVKVDSRPLDDERNRRRFMREMSAASMISGHPHAVSLIDSGVLADGRPYLVMERCDGGSLVDLVERGPLPPADAVSVIESVSSALGAAHAAGVLHRDVKPGNILLDAYGLPRLSDFGISAIVREGSAPSVTLESLTPDFAPPEAFMARPPSPAGDVWSMGAVLLALVTGRGPRQGPDGRTPSLHEIVQRLADPVPVDDPRVPPPLRRLIERAMHPDPLRRFRDGTELTAALAAVREELGEGALTVTGPGARAHLSLAPGLAAAAGPAAPRALAREPGRALALLAVGALLGSVMTGSVLWAVSALRQAGSPTPVTAVTPLAAETPGASVRATPPSTTSDPSPEASPTDAVTPAQVDDSGIPYSDSMPWTVGTCLNGSVGVTGISSASEVDCSAANWIVFAGGTIDPATPAASSSEAMMTDPQVNAICTSQYAQRYGLDLSTSYEIRVLGPTDEEWEAGRRGFSCIYAML